MEMLMEFCIYAILTRHIDSQKLLLEMRKILSRTYKSHKYVAKVNIKKPSYKQISRIGRYLLDIRI